MSKNDTTIHSKVGSQLPREFSIDGKTFQRAHLIVAHDGTSISLSAEYISPKPVPAPKLTKVNTELGYDAEGKALQLYKCLDCDTANVVYDVEAEEHQCPICGLRVGLD